MADCHGSLDGMLHETWRDQYDRLQRSFELFKQVGEPTLMPQEVIPARDVLFHFCCDAFHLRDWIAADLSTDACRAKVTQQLNDDVIFPSPELSACCDVANGSKHLTLTQPSYVTRTTQGHAEVVSHGITIGVAAAVVVLPKVVANAIVLTGTGEPVESVDADPAEAEEVAPPVPAPATSSGGYYQDSFTIDINGQPHDAQDVAVKAMAAWDQWLTGSPLAAQLP